MKTLTKLTTVTLICLLFALNAKSQSHLRWYPFKDKTKIVPQETIDSLTWTTNEDYIYLSLDELSDVDTKEIEEYMKDSTLYFGPSLSFDLFVREKSTGAYKIGAIPGIGYGIKYNPFGWKKGFLIGLDVFAQANVSEEDDTHSGYDYFNVDVIPVITILNWIGIGYGPRFKIGLDGKPSANTSLLSIGIKKSL